MRQTFVYSLVSTVVTIICASLASAQVIIPELEELRKAQRAQMEQMQKLLDQAIQQAAQQPGVPQAGRGRDLSGGMNWGGAKLGSVDKALQEKLGLPESEGLVVTAIDPKSASDKAGLKANDVLVKLNDKNVPNSIDGFIKLLKEQNANEGMDLVVVRDGKEEMLKAAKMPAAVQGIANNGRPIRPGIINIGGMGGIGRIQINGGNMNGARNLDLQMNVNGEKITRKENGDTFFGEYAKDEIKITVNGKFEGGTAKPTDITIQDGKDSKKYNAVKEVPQPYLPMLRRIMPGAAATPLNVPFPQFPGIKEFPNFPMIP